MSWYYQKSSRTTFITLFFALFHWPEHIVKLVNMIHAPHEHKNNMWKRAPRSRYPLCGRNSWTWDQSEPIPSFALTRLKALCYQGRLGESRTTNNFRSKVLISGRPSTIRYYRDRSYQRVIQWLYPYVYLSYVFTLMVMQTIFYFIFYKKKTKRSIYT